MFSERLRELRNNAGISQKSLAAALQVSQQAVAKWESESSSPNPEMLSRIADYFGVSADYLLGKTDIKKTSGSSTEVTDEDIQFALFGGKVSKEAYEDVKNYARYVKERNERNK